MNKVYSKFTPDLWTPGFESIRPVARGGDFVMRVPWGKWGYFILISLFLHGCTSTSSIKDISRLAPDDILVFGRIAAVNYKEGYSYDIYLQPEGDQHEIRLSVINADDFYWALKPGKYTITSFGMGGGFGRIWVHFEVKPEKKFNYIGTLLFMAGGLSKVAIKNDVAPATEKLKSRFNLTEARVSIHLMRGEE